MLLVDGAVTLSVDNQKSRVYNVQLKFIYKFGTKFCERLYQIQHKKWSYSYTKFI